MIHATLLEVCESAMRGRFVLLSETPVRIIVSDIPAPGRKVAFDLATPWAREAASLAVGVEPSSLSGSMLVEREKKAVSIAVEGSLSAGLVCERCGEDVSVTLRVHDTLIYQPEAPVAEGEIELEEADLDTGWYADDQLELESVLSEAIALALPPRAVCEHTAACEARTEAMIQASFQGTRGHPAFAALKDFS